MKSLIVAGLVLLVSAPVWACQEFTGTFHRQNSSGKTQISLKQEGCQTVDVTITFTPTNGYPSVSHYDFAADGVLRRIGTVNAVDTWTAIRFEGDHMDQLTIYSQNGALTPRLSSVTDTFKLDSEGNLVQDTIAVDVNGNVRPAELVFGRGD